MNVPLTLDTLDLFDELKKSFSEEQAHVLCKTWQRVEEKRQRIDETRLHEVATKGDLLLTKNDLHREIEEVRLEIEKVRGEVIETKKEIAEAKADTIKWMVMLAVAQFGMMTGILFTLFRLLPGG